MDWKSHFYGIADKWVDDAYVTRPSEAPDIVYHYTDAAGLSGMLRSNKIWATDYRFLNDRSEIEHTRGLAKDIIRRLRASSHDETLIKLYDAISIYQGITDSDDVFIFSLSVESDDLSQWRGYAREGHGFTVGFDGAALNDDAGSDNANFSFFRVEYDLQKQCAALEKALAEIQHQVVALVKDNPDHKAEIVGRAAAAYDWFADQRAAGNKHKSFRSEGEWRMLTYMGDDEKDAIKTRVSGERLVNFVELTPRGDIADRLPIRSVGVGPGFVGAEQVYAVKALFLETGYSPDIYYADTPFRRLPSR